MWILVLTERGLITYYGLDTVEITNDFRGNENGDVKTHHKLVIFAKGA